jgi:hypothetical protein
MDHSAPHESFSKPSADEQVQEYRAARIAHRRGENSGATVDGLIGRRNAGIAASR